MKKIIIILILSFNLNFAQNENKTLEPSKISQTEKLIKKWYEAINIRGYAQIRYNNLLQTNSELGCEQCDR